MIEFTEVIHEKHEFFFTKRESIYYSCISLLTIVTMALAAIGLSPKPQVQANNYDVVIEATIGQEDYKVLEINNTTGDVNFYEFTVDGDPVLDGNNEQTTFVPGDNDFEDRLTYLNDVIIFSSLTIASSNEFALPIFVGDGYYGDTITQVCYDGDSSTDYRVVQHNELDDPFIPASLIGTFAYMEVGETTYTGCCYTPNSPLGQWDQAAINGANSNSTSSRHFKMRLQSPISYTIIGTTSSGKTVKIEDTGDGSGTHVYEWVDKNGDGEIQEDEWEEVENKDLNNDGVIDENDDRSLDELMDEIADDLENGTGSYEVVKAEDGDGNPVDIIIWFKKSDGSFIGIKMDYTGDGQNDSWSITGRNDVSEDCRIYLGYTPASGDSNPTGSWSIGSKKAGSNDDYGWQNYARFTGLDVDPNGEQKQYCFNGGTTPLPFQLHSGYFYAIIKLPHGAWPPEPCPPV